MIEVRTSRPTSRPIKGEISQSVGWLVAGHAVNRLKLVAIWSRGGC